MHQDIATRFERKEMNELAHKFHQLFAGSERAHGTCEVTDEKRIAAISVRTPATPDMWEKHLEGLTNLGIVPIKDDSTCVFGTIDVDSSGPEVDLTALALQIDRINLPLVACRSKSGGAHLHLFTRSMPAPDMQDYLRYCAKRLGHPHAEVFPKQSSVNVVRGDIGSWSLMPYFNYRYTKRYAVDARGVRLSAEKFLELATSMTKVAI